MLNERFRAPVTAGSLYNRAAPLAPPGDFRGAYRRVKSQASKWHHPARARRMNLVNDSDSMRRASESDVARPKPRVAVVDQFLPSSNSE